MKTHIVLLSLKVTGRIPCGVDVGNWKDDILINNKYNSNSESSVR